MGDMCMECNICIQLPHFSQFGKSQIQLKISSDYVALEQGHSEVTFA